MADPKPQRMQIDVMVPCSYAQLQDVCSKEPVTRLALLPHSTPGRPYNEFSNCPVNNQPWRVLVNNNDDFWMIKDFEDLYHANEDFAFTLFASQKTEGGLTLEFLEAMGFHKE